MKHKDLISEIEGVIKGCSCFTISSGYYPKEDFRTDILAQAIADRLKELGITDRHINGTLKHEFRGGKK